MVYTTPLSKAISKHPDVKYHFYADDTQLFIHLTHVNASTAFDKLRKCLDDVKLWLATNKLKLNTDKTDFIIFGSRLQRKKLENFLPVDILGELLTPSDAVKNLGVWFDSDFSLSNHVQNICMQSLLRADASSQTNQTVSHSGHCCHGCKCSGRKQT